MYWYLNLIDVVAYAFFDWIYLFCKVITVIVCSPSAAAAVKSNHPEAKHFFLQYISWQKNTETFSEILFCEMAIWENVYKDITYYMLVLLTKFVLLVLLKVSPSLSVLRKKLYFRKALKPLWKLMEGKWSFNTLESLPQLLLGLQPLIFLPPWFFAAVSFFAAVLK